MDHCICLNSLSLPAQTPGDAYSLLLDACYGLLEIIINENDRFLLYYDDIKNNFIYDCVLAKDYTYHDFLNELKAENKDDLLLFLLEMEDKSPALDHILNDDEKLFEELSSYNFYLPDFGLNKNMDTLGIAWLLDAILLSLLTDDIWSDENIEFGRLRDGNHFDEKFVLKNIATQRHGVLISRELTKLAEQKLDEICPECIFAEEFTNWYNHLDENNSHRVRDKLRLASERKFQGGKPLFDSLENSGGIREMRFSAYPGGAIRLLFGSLQNQSQAMLIGFIKKRNDQGYKENIPKAKKILKIMKNG